MVLTLFGSLCVRQWQFAARLAGALFFIRLWWKPPNDAHRIPLGRIRRLRL